MVLLIPLYNKIRITFLDVAQDWLARLHGVFSSLALNPSADFEWDVRLTTTNNFKRQALVSVPAADERERLLLKPQPRFMWSATLRVFGTDVLELLIDATDMALSFPVRELIWHHSGFKIAAKSLLENALLQASLADALTPRFLTFLKKKI